MHTRHHPLVHVGSVCALALTFFGCWWVNSLRELTDAQKGAAANLETAAIAAIHEEGDKTRTWAGEQLGGIRADFQKVEADLVNRADLQLTGVRADLRYEAFQALQIANQRLGETLTVVDTRTAEALQQIADFRQDLHPTLANTAAITGQAEEAAAVLFRRDALPAETLGFLGAGKVALGETAETMRTVRKAAPQVADSVIAIGKNADGITADIHTATSQFVKPKTFWQGVKQWAYTAARAAAAFL